MRDVAVRKIEVIMPKEEVLKGILPSDKWNNLTVKAQGNRLQHILNGKLVSEVIDEDPKARKSGIIALQLHQGAPMKVEFTRIRLKILDSGDPPKGGH